MGIFDDMENFIFDRFSVTKRHNVHRVISITNTGGSDQHQQQGSSELMDPRLDRRDSQEQQQLHGQQPQHRPQQQLQQSHHHHAQNQQHRQQPLTQPQPQLQQQPSHHHHIQNQQHHHQPLPQQQQQHQQQSHHHHQHNQQHCQQPLPQSPQQQQHHLHQQQSHHNIQNQHQQHRYPQSQIRQSPQQQRHILSHHHQQQQQQQSHHPHQHHKPAPLRSQRSQEILDYQPHSSVPSSPTVPRTGMNHFQMQSSSSVDSPMSPRRSPQVSNSRIPSSSPFRDRKSWHERSRPPTGYSEVHSPQLDLRGLPSPARSRHRASWVELSNLSGSFDFPPSPHPLRRSASSCASSSKPDSPTSAAVYNNVNNSNLSRPPSAGPLSTPNARDSPTPSGFYSRPASAGLATRSPSSERPHTPSFVYDNHHSSLPPSSPSAVPKLDSPTTPQKQNARNEKHVLLPSTFRSEPHLASLGRPECMVVSGELPQFGVAKKQPNGVVVTKFCRPKLVRLRSEPTSPFSSHSGSGSNSFSAVDPQSPQSAIRCRRRRREELKRSQSLDVTSSGSCQEELWTGINVPSQLVITRPQLSRASLNRRHLSLHLDCTDAAYPSHHSLPCMSGDCGSGRSYPPLLFHDTHGDNIQLLNNKSRARRHESFCKGICFSNRPVHINEKVYVKFVETNTSWSGVLRFGFTSIDPASIQGQDLPRYACPDLTNKPGNWAKALGERYTTSNILLSFSVNAGGDVTYGVNGEEKGIFFSSVVTTGKLWAMLDVYGNTVAVEFSHANAVYSDPDPSQSHLELGLPLRSPDDVISAFSQQALDTPGTPGTPTSSYGAHPAPILYHAGLHLSPMPMHVLKGRNVRISGEDRRVATRLESEYCNSLVFSSRPMKYGETIVIQILSVDRSYIGGLGFGLTACNPSDVDPSSLPDDSDYLLDRLEYWVVNKDVCSTPEVGDELSFHLSVDGEVRYSRNNKPSVTLMHVDRTLPLWVFFDVYGNIQEIKILGCTMAPVQGCLGRPACTNTNVSHGSNTDAGGGSSGLSVAMPTSQPPRRPPGGMAVPSLLSLRSNSEPNGHPTIKGDNSNQPSSLPATPLSDGQDEECQVCYEELVNCVIYKCGHMCLCNACAQQIKKQKGQCPICRNPITDIIKVYRS